MRNMKSLHIFQIILIKREEKFQGSLSKYKNPKDTLGMWKSKGQCNPKVTMEFYICNFLIWENGRNFSSHTLCWLVNTILLILFSPLSCELWKHFVVLISCCSYPFADYSLIMWIIWIASDVHMRLELFPSAC